MAGQRRAMQGPPRRRAAPGQMLLPWAPLMLALGIGLWFAWPGTPGALPHLLALALLALPVLVWRQRRFWLLLAALALAGCALGFLAMALRAEWVAAPVLAAPYYGPVEGRVVHIDRGRSDKLRLTLDQLRLDRRGDWPETLRLTLQQPPEFDPMPGTRVMVMAWASAPEGASEPGGFNFARHAWFRGLGAVGSARGPLMMAAPSEGLQAGVARLRMQLSAAVQARIPGEPGAFAAAMLTGDRSAMGQQAVSDLRASNLYHLVSISGVHMSLLAAFVYQALRVLLALVPLRLLRWPGHKVAALGALPVCTFYLVLSGGDVATLRAWVMVAVMLGAILVDRRALSLRSVALAAVMILLLTPEALTEPGFQMSFAATTALVAGLEALRRLPLPRLLRPVMVVLASSVLAGLASAPYAAAHFYRFSPWGLVPNLLVSPLMGFLVMPGGVLLAVLAPLGLEAPARWMLQAGTTATLEIAAWSAAWPGMVRLTPRPESYGLVLLSLAGLAAVLLPGRWRLAGAGLAFLAIAGFVAPQRPDLLISADGRVSGVLTDGGRVVSHSRGAGFAVRGWLEADGDGVSQAQAAARPGYSGAPQDRRITLGGLRLRHLRYLPVGGICDGADLVILAVVAPAGDHGCRVIDAQVLAHSGALAISLKAEGLQIRAAREDPARPWTPRPAKLP